MIDVVLVDDQTLVRSGIRSLLDLTDDIRVVGEAGEAATALELIAQLRPDLILLDVRMPGRSGIELIGDLKRAELAFPVILLTTFDDDEALLDGMRAGAQGFLLKDVSMARLTRSIREVFGGKSVFRPGVTERAIKRLAALPAKFERYAAADDLTEREVEVLSFMAAGMNNREIGEALGMGEGTVKNHVSSILSKLGVRDRVRAVLRGLELGSL